MLWPESSPIRVIAAGDRGGRVSMSRGSVARVVGAAAVLTALGTFPTLGAERLASSEPGGPFPALPLPPAVDGLVGFPQTYSRGRSAHLPLVTRAAEAQGLPPALADAVAFVESAYDPNAVGGVGEVGLMQIRPETAAMLGYRGPVTGLFEPETNVRYSVEYLAGAWRLANGDLCRALMKYRAGHGEERMSPLSVEYCRRARSYLAAIGSPLGAGALPIATARVAGVPPRRAPLGPGRLKVAAVGEVKLSEAQARALAAAREQERARRAKSRQLWAAHAARLQAIEAKLKPAHLRISSGI